MLLYYNSAIINLILIIMQLISTIYLISPITVRETVAHKGGNFKICIKIVVEIPPPLRGTVPQLRGPKGHENIIIK